jgi:uncharacterized protein
LSSIRILPERARVGARTLIAGFHGIGATGYWSVKFMITELKATRVCYVDSEYAPAVSSTINKEISTPYEVFALGDLAFFKADVPPLRENENRFFRELAEWVVSSGVEEVALIGGLDESLKTDDSRYRVVLTDAMAKRGDLKDEPVLEEGRMIVGPVAIMLNLFQMHAFPAYALLAYSNTERVDPRAAATAVEFMAKRYAFQVSTSPLIKGAEELERELIGLSQKEKERERPSSAIYS